MRELCLDYRRANPIQHRLGVLVLLLLLAGAAVLGIYYSNLTARAERIEAQVERIEHKLHPGGSAERASTAGAQQAGAELKAANEVIMQLTLPWSGLFDALEEANSANIALLGIEPNAAKRMLRLSGEAKNSAALFDYIRILQASKSLSGVYLKHQQVQEQNPEKPVRFILDASWT